MARRVVKEPDIRRQELLETAMRLFIERGYTTTPVQAITDEVGVAKGTFYHYFTSKEDLLDQLVDWQTDVVFDAVEARAREIEGHPLEELRELVQMLYAWKYEDMRELTTAYVRLLYRPESLKMRSRLMNESLRRLHPLFHEVIAEGASLGVFGVRDPEAATDIILSIYKGTSEELVDLLGSLGENPRNVDKLISHVGAIETAMERILGIPDGELNLYDYDEMRRIFLEVASKLGEDAG